MNKDFKEHFFKLFYKLKNNENFAFTRFSDGELFIMQGKELRLDKTTFTIGNKTQPGNYAPEDLKAVHPIKHSFVRDYLMLSYKFKKYNYYTGLSCRCCVGQENFNQMLDWYDGDINSEFLTWSNLLVNSNYPLFKEYMLPEFKNHNIIIIVNERSKISLPFPVKKVFYVGDNCIVNDMNLLLQMQTYIQKNDIHNYVFLFSASSLSNYLIYNLFKEYDDNTYIDIGTTLNEYLSLTTKRGYLSKRPENQKVCIW